MRAAGIRALKSVRVADGPLRRSAKWPTLRQRAGPGLGSPVTSGVPPARRSASLLAGQCAVHPRARALARSCVPVAAVHAPAARHRGRVRIHTHTHTRPLGPAL